MSQEHQIIVPQSDPKAGYLARRTEIDAAIKRVLESGRYILGQEVEAFEKDFASFVGASHAIGVGNGTDALELALRSCGIGPGDLVFTVSHTAVATVAAIELVGATPVLVDIDPDTYTMDPESLAEALAHPSAGKPRVILPVHLYGQAADMPAILELARKYKLQVIEDCAQSHGAMLDGRMTGTFGNIAAFSFYPTKNLGAVGDGGMVVTDNAALAERVRLLRQYGWRRRYVSEITGGNSRLDELQAAVLRVKLGYLKSENARRNELARLYSDLLKDTGLILPRTRLGAGHVFHQYVVRSSQRDALAEHLKQEGIGTLIHYPLPIHLQPAYSGRLSRVVSLSHTEKAAQEILSLPMYPQLTEEQVRSVCAAIVKFCRE